MSNKQGGFTLIELILVIVILGILSIVALPRFINLQTEAANAAAEGVAGALAAGSAINYSAALAGSGDAESTTAGCGDETVLGNLLSDALPSEITVTPDAGHGGSALGDPETCTVAHDDGTETATFTLYYVS